MAWRNFASHLLPPAFWLGVWQFGALFARTKKLDFFLPTPWTVLQTLAGLCATGEFWATIALSLGRILMGMVFGTLLGILLAALTCASAWADRLLSPMIRMIRAVPVASFILLVMLAVYRATVPTVIVTLMVLPVVWSGGNQGIRQTDGQLLELARAYRFSRWKKVKLVYLPSVQPYLLSAVTTAMGLAWKSGVAAEVLCTPRQAIGTEVYNAKFYLEIPTLFAWTAVVVILSLTMEWLLAAALRRWKGGSVPCE